MSSQVDQNLLFGFLALQNNFISREALIAAVSAWLVDKSRPLSEILRGRKALADDEFALVGALAAKHLEKHGNDAEKSLAALSTVPGVREELLQLGSPEIDASLAQYATVRADADPQFAKTLTPDPTQASVARFRIMRPHAKGGLGQVYVARDLELNRDVALKEIQIHRADEPESRARFVLEAEITGGLEHPGIVPVYGFGQYADGRPYYAMRFIRGDSLKEAIEQFHKQPVQTAAFNSVMFRNLLGRFIDVCNAIEYAHSRGVLHRDLKPGNIMLGKYGETLVVDWGLARAKGRKEKPASSDEQTLQPRSSTASTATKTGSAIGTPAFMSPEQAAGRLDLLGPATDVYSLGATLYSVLTGKTPFHKAEGEVILRKVQRGEFPRPGEVRACVPKVLEAICLKAMALATANRYDSAAALAADLERWLADELVSAYPERFSERLRRWSRRHRALVGSAAAAVIVVAIVAIGAVFVVNGARRREAIAKEQSQKLYLVAQGYLDRWMPGITEVLRYAPGGAKMRERLLASAATDYERLADFETASPQLELERGRTLLRLGETRRELGKLAEAGAAFEAADAHFEQLGQRHPVLAEAARVERGRAQNRRGAILDASDNPQALAAWRTTIKLLGSEISDPEIDRDRRLVLASAHVSVAEWLEREGQFAPAQKDVDAALSTLSTEIGDASSAASSTKSDQWQRARLTSLRLKARIHSDEGKWAEARALLVQAVRNSDLLLRSESALPSQIMTSAELQIELASVLRSLGLQEQELAACAASLSAYRKLLDLMPVNPDYRESVALTLINRAQLFLDLSRVREAADDLNEALPMLTRLINQHPQIAEYQQEWATGLEASGRLAVLRAEYSAARDALKKSVEIFEKLGGLRPDVPGYRERGAISRVVLARALSADRQSALADKEFGAAAGVLNELRGLAPSEPSFALDIAWLHSHRGGALWDRNEKDQANAEFKQAIKEWTKIVNRWRSPAHDRGLAHLLVHCPVIDLRDSDRAIMLARRAFEATSGEMLARSMLAAALYRAGRTKEALELLDASVGSSPPLAADCLVRALAFHQSGDPAAAQRSFDQALLLQKQQPGDEGLRRLAAEAAEALGLKLPGERSAEAK